MNTFVLVNPKARQGQVEKSWPEMEKELRGALGLPDSDVQVQFTTEEDHGSGFVREALAAGAKRVVVVGGDGTISDALQGFFDPRGKSIAPEAALCVMPAGRGDDFFKMLIGGRVFSSEKAWKQGLELLKNGGPKATDVGRVKWMGMAGREGRYFLNLASFGFPGLVVQRVSTKAGIWGRSRLGNSALTYLAQSASALLEYRPLEVEVKADGKPFFSGKIFSGFVLNGRYNAGGVDWHKDARIDDGEFHLLVMEPRNPVATALSAGKMISGDWEGTAGVHITRAKSVEVSLKGDARKLFPLFEVDGDQPEAPDSRGAVFEILPGAIQVWR